MPPETGRFPAPRLNADSLRKLHPVARVFVAIGFMYAGLAFAVFGYGLAAIFFFCERIDLPS